MLWTLQGHTQATELSPLHSTRPLLLPIWHLPSPLRDKKNYYSRGERCQHSRWKWISFLSPLLPPYKLWQRSVLILETTASRKQSVTVGPGPSARAVKVPAGAVWSPSNRTQPETTFFWLQAALSTFGQISTVSFLLIHLPWEIFHSLRLLKKRWFAEANLHPTLRAGQHWECSPRVKSFIWTHQKGAVSVPSVWRGKLGIFWHKSNSLTYMNIYCVEGWSCVFLNTIWCISISGIQKHKTVCTWWIVVTFVSWFPSPVAQPSKVEVSRALQKRWDVQVRLNCASITERVKGKTA